MNNWTEILGFTAGCFTSVSTLPQLIKTFKKKEAGDVSIGMFLILLTGLSFWVVYGIIQKDMPIILTNILAIMINICMLILKIRYSRKGN